MLTMLATSAASAAIYCEDLNYTMNVVGEARYLVASGTDEYYANAYFDGGMELSLGWGQVGGNLAVGERADLSIGIVVSDQASNDCKSITFKLKVYGRDEACTAAGQTYLTQSTSTINTCLFGGGAPDLFYGTNVLTVYDLARYPSYYYEIETMYSSTVAASDNGCFHPYHALCNTVDTYP